MVAPEEQVQGAVHRGHVHRSEGEVEVHKSLRSMGGGEGSGYDVSDTRRGAIRMWKGP